MMSKLFLTIYRIVLFAYPRSFRSECAPEMIETVRAREVDVLGRAGIFRMTRFWCRELLAVVSAGMRMRWSGSGQTSLSIPQFAAQAWYDTRFALRSLCRSPVFTVTAALTIAIGIGATTTIFSFVSGILLAPLPYQDPAGLVMVSTHNGRGNSISEPEYMAFRTESRSLESVAATRGVSLTLQLDEPRRITAMEATHEIFTMLAVPPLIGRTFTNQEDLPDAARVTVLSHGLWQEMFASDPGAIGQTIILDDVSFEIIGVMPAGFYFPTPEYALWSPYQIDPADLDAWNNHYLTGYARLTDGIDLEAARSEIQAMGDRFVADHPEFLEKLGFSSDLQLLFESMVGETRTPLLVLLGAVGFLLLIGCTNVANLLLARGESRKQDIAVRSALGASRGRVMMQLLIESGVLAAVGGVLGIVLAAWGARALGSAALDTVPRVGNIGVDLEVLAFAAGVTVLTGLLFGMLPAIAGSRSDLQTHLKEGGRTLSGSPRGNHARRVLVACEVALSVVLVIGAGIMLRSLANLQNSELGFRTNNILTMRISLPDDGRDGDEQVVRFYDNLVDEVEALPGVTSAGVVGRLPLFQGIGTWSIQVEGREVSTIGEAPFVELQQLTPGYFDTMDLQLLQGRFLVDADDSGSRMVAVVNETFARTHWSEKSAIGRRFKLFATRLPWMEVVGVVKNERHNSITGGVRPKMYITHAQATESAYRANTTMNLVVYGEGVEGLARQIRTLVNEQNSTAPVYHVQTMEEVKSASMVDRSYPTLLLTIFGLLALFLASIGIYGLVAYQVSQGKHAIGVHVALGATASNVRRMVAGNGLVPVIAGVAIGLTGAFGLTRLLGGLLYEVSPVDPTVYLAVSATLVLVAAAASLVPAMKATRIDPVEVLRAE